MTGSSRRICILGESPLVEEYSSLCLRKGFSVTARVNDERHRADLSEGVKKARSVPRAVDLALELTNTKADKKKKNLVELDKALGAGVPILSSSVVTTATQQAKWISKPGRLIGIGALPSLLGGSLIEFSAAPATLGTTTTRAKEFAAALGKESAMVRDHPGLVMPRILCLLINEAFLSLEEEVAIRQDIDQAMKVGANYPLGPIEWSEKIGAGQIRAVLGALNVREDKRHCQIAKHFLPDSGRPERKRKW